MKTIGYGQTDIGMRRENNEDCFLIKEDLGLYVVCDGMGGHAAGEVAANQAADALCKFFDRRQLELNELGQDGDLQAVQDIVVKAVKYASRAVRHEADISGHPGMGTTLTLLFAIGDRAIIASVGDSRAYHCRDKQARLLTQDHTLANELLIAGRMTAEQARESPFSHYLTRSVGSEEDVKVDTLVAHLVPGDIFLLCTDGLTRYFDNERELGEYMFNEPSSIPSDLVAFANSRGGNDNVTALVVHVNEEPVEPAQRENWQKWFTRVAMI